MPISEDLSNAISWPEGVPFRPLSKSFNVTPDTGVRDIDFDGGYTGKDRKFSKDRLDNPIQVDMRPVEWAAFLYWFKNICLGGARSFKFPVWTGWSQIEALCQFVGEKPVSAKELDSGRLVVTLNIRVKELPTLANDDDYHAALFLAASGDNGAWMDQLDHLVNVQLAGMGS